MSVSNNIAENINDIINGLKTFSNDKKIELNNNLMQIINEKQNFTKKSQLLKITTLATNSSNLKGELGISLRSLSETNYNVLVSEKKELYNEQNNKEQVSFEGKQINEKLGQLYDTSVSLKDQKQQEEFNDEEKRSELNSYHNQLENNTISLNDPNMLLFKEKGENKSTSSLNRTNPFVI